MTFSRMMKYLCLHYWHMLKYGICNHVMYTKQRVNLNFNVCVSIFVWDRTKLGIWIVCFIIVIITRVKEKLLDTSSNFNEWGFKSHILRWIVNNIVPYPYCKQNWFKMELVITYYFFKFLTKTNSNSINIWLYTV